jgi:hypothetical protein
MSYGKVRVGRRVYAKNGTFVDPKVENYSTVLCLTKSSPFGAISPYGLCDEQGRNMENIWQFSKVYPRVEATTCCYSRYDKRVIWSHPAEVHVDKNNRLLPAYFEWRRKGMAAKDAIRYPVGFHGRHNCVGAVVSDVSVGQHEEEHKFLDYVESRRQIYLVVYTRLLLKHLMFRKLRQRCLAGENLLIVEVDGPHQETMDYYKERYNVGDDFIVGNTVDVNKESMRILLNDTKHPFGHGYCLAMALLDKAELWNTDLQGVRLVSQSKPKEEQQAEQEKEQAKQEKEQAKQEKEQAEQEKEQAKQEKEQQAEQQLEQDQQAEQLQQSKRKLEQQAEQQLEQQAEQLQDRHAKQEQELGLDGSPRKLSRTTCASTSFSDFLL